MSEKHLRKELEQAQAVIRQLKGRIERQTIPTWSTRSQMALSGVIDVLGQLEFEADPAHSSFSEGPIGKGGRYAYPMPGQATHQPRRKLEAFQKRLERAVRDQKKKWEDEALGVHTPKAPRPVCPVCNRRGNVGDVVCPRGCGELKVA